MSTNKECPNCGADLEPTFPDALPCPECGQPGPEDQFWLCDLDEQFHWDDLQRAVNERRLIGLVDEACGGIIAYILSGNEDSLMAHLEVIGYV